MVAFGVLTLAEGRVPVEWYPHFYAAKALIVSIVLFSMREPLRNLAPGAPGLQPRGDVSPGLKTRGSIVAASVALGLAVCAAWVLIHEYVPYPPLGSRTAFDPTPLQGTALWPLFLAVRFYGLVVMVPVMEEIFWRSFLLRYLTDQDFRRLPMGTFSASALAIMTSASALAHPEWLVAIVASLAYAFWLRGTRSLLGAVVAHATTNAALGIYVLATGKWGYW
jgi:CAAX prenyl protease-like protein